MKTKRVKINAKIKSETVSRSVRIPVETNEMINKKCFARNIDFPTYMRELIDRDLLADDTVPTLEKKFIVRVIEQELNAQTQQILNILDRNINQNLVKKINEIYGRRPRQNRVFS